MQILTGLDIVLGRLRNQIVGNAIPGIEVEHRVDLDAAAERDQHAVGDVVLGKSGLRGLGAVDIDVEFRIVGLLLDAQIGNATDMSEFGKHLVGDAVISHRCRAIDLNVDRRRQTKVQRLGDDVSRQEIERNPGKFARELLTQRAHVVRGPVVLFFQRDEDVCVGRPGKSRAIVDIVDVAEWQSNVVEDIVDFRRRNSLPNAGLYLVGQTGGLLDTRSSFCAHMQNELAAVCIRKEVLAEERNEREGTEAYD